jgi:prevent-host-death family protein
MMRDVKNDTMVVSVPSTSTNLGKLLRQVQDERRSVVIEEHGTAKAVLVSVRDYVRLAAPEPEVLRVVGRESQRKGADKLTSRQIDEVIKAARTRNRSVDDSAPSCVGYQHPCIGSSETGRTRAHRFAARTQFSGRAYISDAIFAEYCAVLAPPELLKIVTECGPPARPSSTRTLTRISPQMYQHAMSSPMETPDVRIGQSTSEGTSL